MSDPALMNADEAERITLRISLKLDTLADSYTSVMPLIRESVEREAWRVLGYNGVSTWAEDRFNGALTRLGIETRREVVKELTAGGLSSRSIAPIVGVDRSQVLRDRQVVQSAPPEPVAKVTETTKTETYVNTETGEVTPPPPAKITGRDGKQYARPEPKPDPMAAVREYLDDDEMRDSGWRVDLTKALSKAHALARIPLDRVATVSDADLDESVEETVTAINEWHARYKRSRRALRSVQ